MKSEGTRPPTCALTREAPRRTPQSGGCWDYVTKSPAFGHAVLTPLTAL